MRYHGSRLIAPAVLVVLAYLYLIPSSTHLLIGAQGYLMSDGGDPTVAPFYFAGLAQLLREHPLWLFFGGIPFSQLDPPKGMVAMIPFLERFLGAIAALVLPAENVATAFVALLMLMGGGLFYRLAREWGWGRPISLGLAIAFAFNPFSRARAQAHTALVGTYYLPAVMLALVWLKENRSRQQFFGAMGLMALAAMTAHYYWMCLVVLSPLFIWYAVRGVSRSQLKPLALRIFGASVPAVLMMAWSVLVPAPEAFRGVSSNTPPPDFQYVVRYSARLIDYFSGDHFTGPTDINPIRKWVNESIWSDWDGSNRTERANGVRWTIWVLALLGIGFALRRRLPASEREEMVYWGAFAFFALVVSLPPGLGPSHWVFKILPHLRVPSRFGPSVHFGLLVMAGICLKFLSHRIRRPGLLWFFPALMVLEMPPTKPVLLDQVRPPLKELESEGLNCGAGFTFPYFNIYGHDLKEHYVTIQRLRGTSCALANATSDYSAALPLIQLFGSEAVRSASKDASRLNQLLSDYERLIRCSRAQWVVFGTEASPDLRAQVCSRLGFRRVSPEACRQDRSPAAIQPDFIGVEGLRSCP